MSEPSKVHIPINHFLFNQGASGEVISPLGKTVFLLFVFLETKFNFFFDVQPSQNKRNYYSKYKNGYT